MSASRSPAVLFHIDGALVDSNYLHVHAWARAFHDVGIAVEAWRIHRSIGMDGCVVFEDTRELTEHIAVTPIAELL